MMYSDLTCGDGISKIPPLSPRLPAVLTAFSPIWVSTDLQTWCPRDANRVSHECQINDRWYRQLDPDYFAWLKLRMHAVKAAADAGRVPPEDWEASRAAFNAIQAHAIGLFSEELLLHAMRTLDAEKYRPPLPEEFEKPNLAPKPPQQGPNTEERLSHASELITAIRNQALALGWSEARLSAVPPEAHRGEIAAGSGLVCYLRPGDQIGEVTREAIEIILSNGVRQHFYNPDVEQPWIRRASPE